MSFIFTLLVTTSTAAVTPAGRAAAGALAGVDTSPTMTATASRIDPEEGPPEIVGLEGIDALETSVAIEARPGRSAEENAGVDEIVVTGSRTEKALKDAPVATEVINRAEIERSGAEHLGEVLEEHPGIELQRSRSGLGVRLQGLDLEHVLFLVDGERVTGRFRGGIDPTRFDLEDVEQVEIVKGASSALYGSEAIGGVINVITRNAEKPFEGSVRGVYGSLNTLDLAGTAGIKEGDLRSQVSLGWHRSDGFDLDPKDLASTGAAYSGISVADRSEYRIDEKVRLKGRAEYRLLDQDAIDIIRGTGAVFDRSQSTEIFSASLGSEIAFTDPSRLSVSAHYSRFRLQILQDQRGDDAEDRYDDDRQQIGQLSLQYDRLLLTRHLVSLGLEGLVEREEVAFLEGGSRGRRRGAVYVQDEWTIASDEPALVAVPGVRADLDSQFGSRLSPKIAVRLDPARELTVRFSYGFGFRAPTFEELFLRFENPGSGYFITGNPELRPEIARGVNAGAEYRAASWATLSANFFHNRIENLIDTLRTPGAPGELTEFAYVNVASARTQGVETSLHIEPTRRFRVDLGYVLTDTRDLENRRPLPGRALHKGTLRLDYRDDVLDLDASLRASLVGERLFFEDFDANGRPDAGAPYATVDGRLAKGLGEHLTLFAGVENILDEGDIDLLPIPPRSFYVGVSARYAVADERAGETARTPP